MRVLEAGDGVPFVAPPLRRAVREPPVKRGAIARLVRERAVRVVDAV